MIINLTVFGLLIVGTFVAIRNKYLLICWSLSIAALLVLGGRLVESREKAMGVDPFYPVPSFEDVPFGEFGNKKDLIRNNFNWFEEEWIK